MLHCNRGGGGGGACGAKGHRVPVNLEQGAGVLGPATHGEGTHQMHV